MPVVRQMLPVLALVLETCIVCGLGVRFQAPAGYKHYHMQPASPTKHLSIFDFLSRWYGKPEVLWSLKQYHNRWAQVEFTKRFTSLKIHRLQMIW